MRKGETDPAQAAQKSARCDSERETNTRTSSSSVSFLSSGLFSFSFSSSELPQSSERERAIMRGGVMPGACCGAVLVLALSWAARGETLGSGLQGLLTAAVVLLRVRRVYLLDGG